MKRKSESDTFYDCVVNHSVKAYKERLDEFLIDIKYYIEEAARKGEFNCEIPYPDWYRGKRNKPKTLDGLIREKYPEFDVAIGSTVYIQWYEPSSSEEE